MSTIWEDTDGCDNKYRCALDIYLMAELSSSYGIIMDRTIILPYHVNNVVYIINATEKHYLNGEMEIIGKLGSNYTTNIGLLPSASKDVSVKFAYQCLHILNSR